MATLHTVNRSPFQDQALLSCLRHVKKGDSVLLFEDGVYGAMSGTALSDTVAELGADVSVYALDADVAARGIDSARLLEGVALVDYAGFVDLAANTERTQNWL